MAEIFKAELAEAGRRRSGQDLNTILHALEADGSLTVVDDPAPETGEQTNPDTGETEEIEVPYAAGPELAIKVDADEAAAAEAAAEAEAAAAEEAPAE